MGYLAVNFLVICLIKCNEYIPYEVAVIINIITSGVQ